MIMIGHGQPPSREEVVATKLAVVVTIIMCLALVVVIAYAFIWLTGR